MKRLTIITIVLMVLAVAAGAQVPQTISYQGVLTDGAGTPAADGSYELTFKIYSVASGGSEIWTETQSVSVTGGIFSAILGSVNPLAIAFDAPCWLGVAVGAGPEFTPRRELTAAPYSLTARSVENYAVTATKIADGTVVRSLNALTDDVTLAPGTNVAITASGDSLIISSSGGGSGGWSLTGNSGTDPVTDFVGTTDNVALELRVSNQRVLRLIPHATSPNLVAGHFANSVDASGWGQTVAGGGEDAAANQTIDVYGTVGGGAGNSAGSLDGNPSSSSYATVAGGQDNRASAAHSFVGGGMGNRAMSGYSVIGGGSGNSSGNLWATISGGRDNQVSGTTSVVGGGLANQATNNYTTVGGGNANIASGIFAVIAGGNLNTASGERATISGGTQNYATARAATVGGGEVNRASEFGATVGGGWSNRVYGVLGTIAGGGGDAATTNRVTDNYGSIGGGGDNQAGNGEDLLTDAQGATVGGGLTNRAEGASSTIAGGINNYAGGMGAFVGGGNGNAADGEEAVVSGGGVNAAIANRAVVVGGVSNQVSGDYSFVGGGSNNVVGGLYAAVPGGRENAAAGDYSFAAGRRAKVDAAHAGTFLYADGNDVDFNSAANHEFAVRATGGVRFVTAIDGAGNPTAGVTLPAGGGAWSPLSDRNAKENFVAVDGVAVLERLAAMEILTWNYKSQDARIRHMGPVAQDFYAAFGVGEDEKRISTVDADGVALAAIQGLKQIVDRKDARIAQLERRVAELERLMASLASTTGNGATAGSGTEASAR